MKKTLSSEESESDCGVKCIDCRESNVFGFICDGRCNGKFICEKCPGDQMICSVCGKTRCCQCACKDNMTFCEGCGNNYCQECDYHCCEICTKCDLYFEVFDENQCNKCDCKCDKCYYSLQDCECKCDKCNNYLQDCKCKCNKCNNYILCNCICNN